MGEWDFEDEVSGSTEKGHGNDFPAGGLNVPMTLACLIGVAAVSFGAAWLMKDRVRSFWEMGITFAAPFAALMISALTVESSTSKMTPACSRRAQTLFGTVTVAVAFIFGCLTVVLHQPVVITHVEPEYDYVIVEDKSGSMIFTEMEEPSKEALHTVLDNFESECRVGYITFGSEVTGEAEIHELDAGQREKISALIDQEIPVTDLGGGRMTGPGTQFTLAMRAAQRLVDSLPERVRPMRMILVTDGDDDSEGNFETFSQWAEKINEGPEETHVELSVIQLGNSVLPMVREAVQKTGGQIYDRTDPKELAAALGSLKSVLVIPEAVDTLKATYNGQTADGKPNTPYVILTGIMLLLLGLLCGFSLMIMFSLRGQFRIQVILSALAGICAFLLLNFGRFLPGDFPAWICEGTAFSLFGIVFMRENLAGSGNRKASAAKKPKTAAAGTDAFIDGEDF